MPEKGSWEELSEAEKRYRRRREQINRIAGDSVLIDMLYEEGLKDLRRAERPSLSPDADEDTSKS